jgi:hypothetical protein
VPVVLVGNKADLEKERRWQWMDGCWFDRCGCGMAGSAVGWRSFWWYFLGFWGSIGGAFDMMSIAAFFLESRCRPRKGLFCGCGWMVVGLIDWWLGWLDRRWPGGHFGGVLG